MFLKRILPGPFHCRRHAPELKGRVELRMPAIRSWHWPSLFRSVEP